MAKNYPDRVKQTSTDTGTGTLDLTGTVSGFQTFVAGVGDGNTCDYVIFDPVTFDWETGEGTVTDAATDTLSRDTVYESTNSDALVNFASNTKIVAVDLPGSVLASILSDIAALQATVAPNAQTGTTYTAVLGDANKLITMSNASANTFTIPANSSVAYDVGTTLRVIQLGAGTTSVEGDTGVTVNGVSAGSCDINNQYQGVVCEKIATDTWLTVGDRTEVA